MDNQDWYEFTLEARLKVYNTDGRYVVDTISGLRRVSTSLEERKYQSNKQRNY